MRRLGGTRMTVVPLPRIPVATVQGTLALELEPHRRALLVARAGGHQPGVARVQPVRPQVRSVHTWFVTPRVAETSIHVRYGERSRAVAARFEQRRGRWLCSALDFA